MKLFKQKKKMQKIPIYCINLATRQDRWKKMEKWYAPYKDIIELKRFEAMEAKKGGPGLSHQALIRQAQHDKAPYLWVLEDDARPHEKHFRYMMEVLFPYWLTHASCKEHNALLGATQFFQRSMQRFHQGELVEIQGWLDTHCICYRSSGYEVVLQWSPTKGHSRHFDEWLSRFQSDSFRVICVVPFAAIQAPDLSNNERSQRTDYRRIYKETERDLRMI